MGDKERLVTLLQRDFVMNDEIKKKIESLKSEIETNLPKEKREERIKNLKKKFFDLDEKMNKSNAKQIKDEKSEVLHKLMLEQKEDDQFLKKQLESIKNDPRFVFIVNIEGSTDVSYSCYKDLKGLTSMFYPVKELVKKGNVVETDLWKKLIGMVDTKEIKGLTPSANRVIYGTYCQYVDKDNNNKIKEYLYIGIANERSLQKTWMSTFPNHIGLAVQFLDSNNKSASLMERWIACFGGSSVFTFILANVPFPEDNPRIDPIFTKYKDLLTTTFGDLKSTPLGFNLE